MTDQTALEAAPEWPEQVSRTAVKGNPFAPQTLDQAMALAHMLAQSDIVPQQMRGKKANVLLAIIQGAEVGLNPVQALQSVFVVNGRPTLYGAGFLAVIMNHPKYLRHEEYFTTHEGGRTKVDGDAFAAHCSFFRMMNDGKVAEFAASFSLEDAKQAKLYDKENWQKYPGRMMKARARSHAGNDGFPDALRGMVMHEVESDIQPHPQDAHARPLDALPTGAGIGARLDAAPVDSQPLLEAAAPGTAEADKPLTFVDGSNMSKQGGIAPQTTADGGDPGAMQVHTVPFDRNQPLDISGLQPASSLPQPEARTMADDVEAEVAANLGQDDEPKPARKKPANGRRKKKAPASTGELMCPICEGPTTRTIDGKPLSCDDCNKRGAKGES